MSFRSRIYALMAGIVALVLVLVLADWWMSGRALSATDTAYTEGLKLARAIDKARSAQVNFQRQVQEWKNVLIRGGEAALRDTHWKGFEQREQLMDKEWPEEKRDAFLKVLARHPELRGVHDLRTRTSGDRDFVQIAARYSF